VRNEQQHTHQHVKAFTRPTCATGTIPQKSSSRGFRRAMKTVAAADADRAAAERAVTEAAELSAAMPSSGAINVDDAEAGGQHQHNQHQAAPPPKRQHSAMRTEGRGPASSFLNRKLPPRPPSQTEILRQKLQGGRMVAEATAAAEAATATAVAGMDLEPQLPPIWQEQQAPEQKHSRGSLSKAAALSGAQPTAASPVVPAACRPATAVPAATFHRTAEGLNVVYLSRRTQSDGQAAGGGKAKSTSGSVNTGWGTNFVRMDLKVGHDWLCGNVWCMPGRLQRNVQQGLPTLLHSW
jgi:hypothetical protein